MQKNNFKNEKGQVLLFVVVAVTIALAVGVTVASRNLSSSSRTTRTDTASRAYAAAEGGLERLRSIPDATKETLTQGGLTSGVCQGYFPNTSAQATTDGKGCSLTFSNASSITSIADVTVEKFKFNDGANTHYFFDLNDGNTKEVVLQTPSGTQYSEGKIKICWGKDDNTSNDPAIYMFLYDTLGHIQRQGVAPSSFSHSSDVAGFATATAQPASEVYDQCYELTFNANITGTVYGLRVRALYGNTTAGVYPNPPSTLPDQGYKMTSVGRLKEEGQVKESKKIIFYRSLPYLPGFFDYNIFSLNGQLNSAQ